MKIRLVCTVGGSHEPILRAIDTVQPDVVCFVCSEDDPASGRPGSHVQVTGQGLVIKAKFTDEKPTLPNIPTQAGLSEDQVELIRVAPDDFDAIYAEVIHWLRAHWAPQQRIVADYTGGTKTMSAALVAAALDTEGVELQLVSGSRINLFKVESGSEQAMPACIAATRFKRNLDDAINAWRRYAWEETAARLLELTPPSDSRLRGQHQRVLDLSRALAAWDRFDHQQAHSIIQTYRQVLGKDATFRPLLGTIGLLVKDRPAREPLRLFDLWRNAQRRAGQQRFDDAVARLYRLLEWSAQWLLRETTGIETADVPEPRIPKGMVLSRNREGKYQAALSNSWALAAHYGGENIKAFWQKQQNTLLDLVHARNHSILAHGFTPLTEQHWKRMAEWTEQQLLPLLLEHSTPQPYRVTRLPEQLPRTFPGVDM